MHQKLSELIDESIDIINITRKFHTLDKLNYVICGDKNKNSLQFTGNPYLYDEEYPFPKHLDIYKAREKIIRDLFEIKIINNV